MMDTDQFLQLSLADILNIQQEKRRPLAGVFVPDGSRRLVLAYTEHQPGTEEFYVAAAHLPAQLTGQAIKIFFKYELPILFVPILGRSILKRGSDYLRLTALEGLRLLFNSTEWLELYEQLDIRVRVYGDLECLIGTPCEPAIEWITKLCQQTTGHRAHQLFYSIGEPPFVGEQMLTSSVLFFRQNGRIPTREEQIEAYYGALVPPLDFFIMTSKMSGMGAMPNLLVNGDTELYFLPSLKDFTETTYRLILYDMLYQRAALRTGIRDFELTQGNRTALREAYEGPGEEIIGLGASIGKIWIPAPRLSNK
jgi:hypothetical protein